MHRYGPRHESYQAFPDSGGPCAARLGFESVANRALLIHEGGDNFFDVPEEAGGGGARIACGIISGDGSESILSEVADPQLRIRNLSEPQQ